MPTSDQHHRNRTIRQAAVVSPLPAVLHHFDGAVLCQIHVFFIRKKFIRKSGSNRQNGKEILRKLRGSISKIKLFY